MNKPSLPRNVIALGIVSALNDMASEIAIRTIPLFLNNVLGVKIGLIGLIEGVAETTSTLLKLVSGLLSDRMGRRKPLTLLGFGLSNAIKPLLFFASSWPSVFALRFLDRVGKGIRTAPRDALLADSVSADDRGRAFGFNRSMDPLGAITALAIAAALVYFGQGGARLLNHETYRLLIVIASVPAIAAVLVLALGVREPRERGPGKRALSLRGTLPPGLRWYLLAVFVFNMSATSDAFLVLRAQQLQVPLWGVFALLGLFNITISLVALPAGKLSDRIGRRGILVAGWITFALLLIGFAFASEPVHLVALFVLYGVHLGLTEGVEKALLADLAPPECRGTAFGYLQLAIGAAALPASLLTGVLWQAFGARPAFAVGGAIAIMAVTLLLLVPGIRSGPQR